MRRILIFIPVILLALSHLCTCNKKDDDEGGGGEKLYFSEINDLSPKHRKAIEKVRREVEDDVPESYMTTDLYLSRWLRVKDWKVDSAISAIKRMIEWRKENKIEEITTADFEELEDDFTVYMDGYDKEGRIILEAPYFGEWPLKKAIDKGYMEALKFYATMHIEKANALIYELQEKENRNISQWVWLANADGYKDDYCYNCYVLYAHVVDTFERYYPFSVGHIVFVNVPPSFEPAIKHMESNMHKTTKEESQSFGSNSRQWKPYIEKYFGDQIGEGFGGTKKREIKKSKFKGRDDDQEKKSWHFNIGNWFG